jgi:hypothetical protein
MWHPLFKKHLEGVNCDFLAILDFLTHHGSTDVGRDGPLESAGKRYDFGVGNQSYETNDESAAGFHDAPKVDCGMDELKAYPDSAVVMSSVAALADAVQQLFDELMEQYIPAPARLQNDFMRNELFSKRLCGEMLKCQHARYEWFTLLCKCLSAKHYVADHYDKNNCSAPGYRHTANFSIVLSEKDGTIWRLSVLFNLRQVCGDYMAREDGVKPLLQQIPFRLWDKLGGRTMTNYSSPTSRHGLFTNYQEMDLEFPSSNYEPESHGTSGCPWHRTFCASRGRH